MLSIGWRRSSFGSARRALCGCLLLALAACSAPQSVALRDAPGDLPPRVALERVPFFPQEDYYCGPAALAMALVWAGEDTTPEALVPEVYTPGREGTLRTDILAAARRHGRVAVPVGSLRDLLGEIAAGHPVIVFQNLGIGLAPQWHFAVAVGYDLPAREILLHTGLEAGARRDLDTFERTWARGDHWALAVLPAGRLPATAGERSAIEAAIGLERAGRHAAAATTYAAIAARWPESFIARMGQGNALYAAGDPQRAESAFRSAIAVRPDAPAAWNNLAHALHAQGKRTEAQDAARHAIGLAGADDAPYRETLRTVSRAP